MLRLRWIFCKKRRDRDGEMWVKKKKTHTHNYQAPTFRSVGNLFCFLDSSVKTISLVGGSYLRKKILSHCGYKPPTVRLVKCLILREETRIKEKILKIKNLKERKKEEIKNMDKKLKCWTVGYIVGVCVCVCFPFKFKVKKRRFQKEKRNKNKNLRIRD